MCPPVDKTYFALDCRVVSVKVALRFVNKFLEFLKCDHSMICLFTRWLGLLKFVDEIIKSDHSNVKLNKHFFAGV